MIRYTFLGDGSSDKALMKIIDWTFSQNFPELAISAQLAEFTHVREKIKTLEGRISKAIDLYPCDILFVHRDAEEVKKASQIVATREKEINEATKHVVCPYVPIVPVKMMETWLLTDIFAIRKAAGNRNSTVPIVLPNINKLETENNPKEMLHNCLKIASCLTGRRLESFNVGQAVHRVAEYTDDFSKLRGTYAYNKFEEKLKEVVTKIVKN